MALRAGVPTWEDLVFLMNKLIGFATNVVVALCCQVYFGWRANSSSPSDEDGKPFRTELPHIWVRFPFELWTKILSRVGS
jgi:hypothetical protein